MSKTLATASAPGTTRNAAIAPRRGVRAALVVAGALALLPTAPRAQPDEAPSPAALAQIAQLVKDNYLLPIAVDGAADETLLGRLDPQSSYLSVAEIRRLQAFASTVDPGVLLLPLAATSGPEPLVGRSAGGGRAAGVRAGDILVAIDGEPTAGQSEDALRHRMRGPAGTSVRLTVRRDGKTLDLVAERAAKQAGAEISARRIGNVGYVRIDSLDEGTVGRLAEAVKTMQAQTPGLKGLVLDLRDCPGGLLEQALRIADLFLTGGPMLTQRGREASDVTRRKADRDELLSGHPVVVLVNARTVAGAEIVAGVLQERGRARVVGMPTYGNGLIQTVIPLNGARDGALRLTTGAWYLPSGRPLQKSGITPDVVVAADARDLAPQPREINIKGALDAPTTGPVTPPPSVGPPELPPPGYDTEAGDYQLDRALAIVAR